MTGKSERQRLQQALAAVGHTPFVLRDAAGASALLLPFGGRVLGLFTPQEGPNLFWANPALYDVATARQVLDGPQWPNLGGDRTWIGPEAGLFVSDLADIWGSYRVPAALDPGPFSLSAETDGATLSLATRLTVFRPRAEVEVRLQRRVRLLPNPLRDEPDAQAWWGEVAYAGYELETRLSLEGPGPHPALDLWNILALPAGGWITVPTLSHGHVRDYFEPTGPSHLQVEERAVHFRISGQERHKIAVRAADLVGRAGYLHPLADGRWNLLVRQFAVNPSGDYIDTPWTDPTGTGYAFQAYTDNGALGAFGELEYHSPALGGASGPRTRTDVSQVWGFQGSEPLLRALAARLLGVQVR